MGASGIKKIGVVGIGLMGSGIAQVAATYGFDTIVTDTSDEVVKRGMSRIEDSLSKLVASHERSNGQRGMPSAQRDATLAHLTALPRLEYLNLYGTAVTDAGLEPLKGMKRLRKLYLWQTKVSYDPAMALQAGTPGLEVNLGWDHPGVVKVRLTKEMETAKKSAEEATAKAAEAQKQLEAANAEKAAADAKLQEVDKQLKALEPAAPAAEGAAAEKPAW